MKKNIIHVLLVVALLFAVGKMVHASYSFGVARYFGGRIVGTSATEIEELVSQNYLCPLYGGTTLSIIPLGSPHNTPSSYFVPSLSASTTRSTLGIGQLILGTYSGRTEIVCTRPTGEKTNGTAKLDEKVVSLDNINLYGTSRF